MCMPYEKAMTRMYMKRNGASDDDDSREREDDFWGGGEEDQAKVQHFMKAGRHQAKEVPP